MDDFIDEIAQIEMIEKEIGAIKDDFHAIYRGALNKVEGGK
jgi:hypothetical protein